MKQVLMGKEKGVVLKYKQSLSGLLFIASLMLIFSATASIGAEKLSGKIKIDGSSTVGPLTEAVAEEFNKVHPRVRVTVGISGTGGGFKKFLQKETDINDASRVIKASEVKLAKSKGVDYIHLPVAIDGISVVVNPSNNFVKELTVEQLKKLWQPGSKITKWSDLNPKWPERKIKLYGPGPDSGTFDYFTEVIVGKAAASRSDYMKSEDDNILVQGIAGDIDSLGYFGFSYYEENMSKLKAIPISMGVGKKAIIPTSDTIKTLTYKPLSRHIYIYISKAALKRDEVKEFVRFYLNSAGKLTKDIGYVSLTDSEYQKQQKNLEKDLSVIK